MPWVMSAAAKIPVSMTVAEFLNWADRTEGRWQLVDGEPRAMAPPNRTYGTLQTELGARILVHLREAGSPCSVVTGPGIVPGMLSAYKMRVPDLAVTCTPYETEERALSNSVLIAEILSFSNQADTWANVWTYTTIPSVREILVLSGDKIRAELLRRGEDGAWPDQPEVITDGDLVLASIDFHLPVAELYRATRLAPRQD